MYILPYFKESDRQVLLDFMHQHPFAFMTGSFTDGQQVATQVPILVEERNNKLYLQGHIMKKTAHHKVFLENPNAMVVFTGEHTGRAGAEGNDARTAGLHRDAGLDAGYCRTRVAQAADHHHRR